MANKTYTYKIAYCWADEGNRATPDYMEVKATTVPRAISKLVKELNVDPDSPEDDLQYLEKDDDGYVRASDVLVTEVRNITRGWN